MEKVKFCICCSIPLNKRQFKFCLNKCQTDHQYLQWVNDWKRGKNSGERGISAKNISGHLRRFLYNKYDNKCGKCGWNTTNIFTGTSLLEIEHIDGNSENNKEENLTLLCPNCHSLTPFYKNLNRGNGRKWSEKLCYSFARPCQNFLERSE